jgi:hypothetical protein
METKDIMSQLIDIDEPCGRNPLLTLSPEIKAEIERQNNAKQNSVRLSDSITQMLRLIDKQRALAEEAIEILRQASGKQSS